jgi:hypothetical protein
MDSDCFSLYSGDLTNRRLEHCFLMELIKNDIPEHDALCKLKVFFSSFIAPIGRKYAKSYNGLTTDVFDLLSDEALIKFYLYCRSNRDDLYGHSLSSMLLSYIRDEVTTYIENHS